MRWGLFLLLICWSTFAGVLCPWRQYGSPAQDQAWSQIARIAEENQLTISYARPFDVPEIIGFVRTERNRYPKSVDPTHDEDLRDFSSTYNNPDGSGDFLVFRNNRGIVVGTAAIVCCRQNGRAELRKMYLAPELRGKHLASSAVDYFVGEARAMGASGVTLETFPEMTDAIGLYESRHFVKGNMNAEGLVEYTLTFTPAP